MDFLRTEGKNIVDARGSVVRLAGTCAGGWMNLEDFINGHSGAEHTLRHQMAEVLGAARAEFFFERLLEHFFNESDIAYIRSLGATVVRLPLNYRHFEDDDKPYAYKEAGFERLGRVLDWCDKHGLYAILDLHAVQGWQNVHWHSDNASGISLFWHDAHYQDRFVALWCEIARRYRHRAVVAGYNLINEPCVGNQRGDLPWNIHGNYRPEWPLLNAVYRRTVQAIRQIDARHIIFLEGDCYSRQFAGLDAPFAENLVYSSHNYTAAGFGPGKYPGVIDLPGPRTAGPETWDLARQEQAFLEHEGTVFTDRHQVPLWIGEFGSVYNGAAHEVPDRLRAMDEQLGLFERHRAHWTTWTYKDVGVMGLVTLDPASEYMQRVGHFIGKKLLLGTDHWMQWMPPTPIGQAVGQLAEQVCGVIDDDGIDRRYGRACFSQSALCFFTGAMLQRSYVSLFQALTENDIDRTLASFSLPQCRVNQPLEGLIRKYAPSARRADR
ncbi:glycoside hydrolase family 5 protein [Verminephrobacter eiseniae]|uniref:Glycoside hydrolase, family 5 n=1 Tax=Verminephrobacter eiseniae (strain EF01-2) TaxID=391735 RepID=A1WGG4_VEREI|nr:cellulase family glycosylhydrolase [Verminephrobacter eiseniae]ABM56721.1 glycoside hydrolase, family 5 [Verminephrobacter eiseniae EF01-2]MCW5287077.1 glycoside hydrolase family 5 protein [Verminephrobacter eiseniae]MCW5305375.1 glycoside hydrolase family 5 protein [Verminephrobacter eiseniae]MCW8180466.1 glycoside hydrolase family 5 protein [Verminephrobacter eiseniae]MCW8192118.1 glycoside hydrolase family 5 protein [Verminephrobacter eiseniae]